MKAHDLAKILLSQPNVDVTTCANDHFYNSKDGFMGYPSLMKVQLINEGDPKQSARKRLVIGNMDRGVMPYAHWHLLENIDVREIPELPTVEKTLTTQTKGHH